MKILNEVNFATGIYGCLESLKELSNVEYLTERIYFSEIMLPQTRKV